MKATFIRVLYGRPGPNLCRLVMQVISIVFLLEYKRLYRTERVVTSGIVASNRVSTMNHLT